MLKNHNDWASLYSLKLIPCILSLAGAAAVILYVIQDGNIPFTQYVFFAESVGICQGLCLLLSIHLFRRHGCGNLQLLILSILAILAGSILGIQLGAFFYGGEWLLELRGFDTDIVLLTLLIGFIVSSARLLHLRLVSEPGTRNERLIRIKKRLFSARSLLLFLLFNTLIACVLTAINFKNASFLTTFVMSHCIGLSIRFFVWAAFYFMGSFHPLLSATVGVLAGSFAGPLIGSLIIGKTVIIFDQDFDVYKRIILLGLFFGIIGSIYFYIRAQLADAQLQAEKEKAENIRIQKESAETNLRLLQAQIEPHFLFNTLSNIISLLDTDIDKGKMMLEDLTHYLRTSLVRTRCEKTTLAQEMDMVRAYLNIFKIRMGNRLHFTIDIPERLRTISIPSMLIQPLVENAILHGIEPKIEGGVIAISAQLTGETLTLTVADTGRGMNGYPDKTTTNDGGVGLQNIKKRLNHLFGNTARLLLEENTPRGIRATIEVPYEH